MGKRSDFKRRPHDAYTTPFKAARPVFPFLHAEGIKTFVEPCCGEGQLVGHLTAAGLTCTYDTDIDQGVDALDLSVADVAGADAIITNPPWTRQIMHPLIWHFMSLGKPVWLLFDGDWMHNDHAVPFLRHCSHVVSIGRVKWIEKSKHSAKDNACWYRFHRDHAIGPHLYGRIKPDQLDIFGGVPTIEPGTISQGNFVEVA